MKKSVWLFTLGLLWLHAVADVDSTSQQQYDSASIQQKSFNRDTWKKNTDGLDYTDHRKNKEEPKKNTEPKPLPALNISAQTFRVIAFVVLLSLLIFILLRAFGFSIFIRKKNKGEDRQLSIEDFDDKIPESELDRFLREALAQKNFKMAVRIYYLMCIKELSHRNFIKWKKEKTNFDYLNEASAQKFYPSFKENTLLFERVWYGDYVPDSDSFPQLSNHFMQLLQNIKST